MTVLLTGAAGFIGFHAGLALAKEGADVYAVDSLNDYYDPALKQARLEVLTAYPNVRFEHLDIAESACIDHLAALLPETTAILHLAAQAGVRYSLKNPQVYLDSNITGQLNMLELARRYSSLEAFVYASSSSVYGGNTKQPFSESDPVDRPQSVYGMTKRSGELMAYSYGHLYGLPTTGLRFFTVYGPWGRPDMSPYIFTKAIFERTSFRLFNAGECWRDFTYVDDIVSGAIAALKYRPKAGEGAPPAAIFNLGHDKPIKMTEFVTLLEGIVGLPAIFEPAPMQPGDVVATWADLELSERELGYRPTTALAEGLSNFVDWYRDYHKLSAAPRRSAKA
jgi:UDP-glucuronate 4-epimerase